MLQIQDLKHEKDIIEQRHTEILEIKKYYFHCNVILDYQLRLKI